MQREKPVGGGGDLVVRTDFDLTGDGKPEVFLSDVWTRPGRVWAVYDMDDPEHFRYLGQVMFHEKNAWVPEPGVLRVILPGSHEATLLDYHLVDGELMESEGVTSEYSSTDSEEFKEFEARGAKPSEGWRFWKDLQIVKTSVEGVGHGPWLEFKTGKPVVDLRPIDSEPHSVVVEHGSRATLLSHLEERRPCPRPKTCKVWLLYKDVGGDSVPELLLNSPQPLGSPWLLYAAEGDAYRYLGEIELEPGLFEKVEGGDLLSLRLFPLVLQTYRITTDGIEKLETVPVSADRERVLAWRARLLPAVEARSIADYYWVGWQDLLETPQSAPWTPVGGEDSVQLDIDFSAAVEETDSTEIK